MPVLGKCITPFASCHDLAAFAKADRVAEKVAIVRRGVSSGA